MKIYITRHGETKWNKEGRMQGWQDSNLSENGIENAKKLGNRLENIDFDYIYSSPLGRAVDTAKYIRGNKNIEIIEMDSLKEISFGKWEGVRHDEIKEMYPIEHFNFWNKPHLYESIDGENFDEFFLRVESALNKIIKSPSAENILLVSHAVIIKAIYSIIKKQPLENLWSNPFMHNNSLTIVEVIDNEIKIILEADISHLE